ncbi:COMM domain-containing protein 10-like [Leguminivora glycinivorella]|uniref:COMM domain-containing protein 10-like n=1 Tax=Leguminivora glycinivorella TaxID=1035111 RepID=UPI00200E7B63|nr:COMM domain-containing protein 10-like [Leguminivora glycinivorella]
MECQWLKLSASFSKGIAVVNQLDTSKFEQFLRRIVTKLKVQDAEIFTEEEQQKLQKIFNVTDEQLLLAIKTLLYVFKRLLKFVFMPKNLKNDLETMGFLNDKAEIILKTWSVETKTMVNELDTETQKHLETLNFSWRVNAELSSDYHKKSKVPKAYLSFSSGENETEIEFTHPELYSMFLQFESIQNELDNLV